MVSFMDVVLIIFGVIALILTILSMIFIVPRNREPQLSGFFKWLHHVFNFDSLLIEQILKFLYILCSFAAVFLGLAAIIQSFSGDGSVALIGLLLIVLGPIVIRLLYESMMMFVILVKQVSDINRKIKNENPRKGADTPYAPPAPVERAPRPVAPVCPSCGSKMRPGAKFCGICGFRAEPAPAPAPAPQPTANNYYPTDNDL